jgi:hypothetical protein
VTDNLREQLLETATAWDKRSSASESWMPGLIDALLPVARGHAADRLRLLAEDLTRYCPSKGHAVRVAHQHAHAARTGDLP